MVAMIRPDVLVVHGMPRPGLSPAVRKTVQSFIWSSEQLLMTVALMPGLVAPVSDAVRAQRFWDDLFRHGGTNDDVRELSFLACGVDDQDWLVWEGIVQASAVRGIESLEEDPE